MRLQYPVDFNANGTAVRFPDVPGVEAIGDDLEDTLKAAEAALRKAFDPCFIGICAAAGLTRLMQSLLFEVRPSDSSILTGVGALLVAVALVVCITPAWRAASVDPVRALRSE